MDSKIRIAVRTAGSVAEEGDGVGGRKEIAREREGGREKRGVAFTERMNGRGAERNNTCFAERT